MERVRLEQQLNALRRVLLNVHKTLLDAERVRYERVHGRVTSGTLLQLAIRDRQFAWLHPLSELVVRIDQLIDSEEPFTRDDVVGLAREARRLLTPSESGTPFERRYFESLQEEPAAVLAHRDAILHLEADP